MRASGAKVSRTYRRPDGARSTPSRCLRALGERGPLVRADGVLVGRAAARSHLEDDPPEKRADYRKRQRESITGVFEAYNPEAPTVFDCEFGHTCPTCPIPTGGEVEIDPRPNRFAFPEVPAIAAPIARPR